MWCPAPAALKKGIPRLPLCKRCRIHETQTNYSKQIGQEYMLNTIYEFPNWAFCCAINILHLFSMFWQYMTLPMPSWPKNPEKSPNQSLVPSSHRRCILELQNPSYLEEGARYPNPHIVAHVCYHYSHEGQQL